MKTPNEAASALGSMARGHPKRFTKAERKRRSERMRAINAKRRTNGPKPPDADVALFQNIVEAMIAALGHGGLRNLASRLGLSSSVLRKRLNSPRGAFDAATLRAALLIVTSKAESQFGIPATIFETGSFKIELHRQPDGGLLPFWRARE